MFLCLCRGRGQDTIHWTMKDMNLLESAQLSVLVKSSWSNIPCYHSVWMISNVHGDCDLNPPLVWLCICSVEVWGWWEGVFTVALPRNQTRPFVLTPFSLQGSRMDGKTRRKDFSARPPPHPAWLDRISTTATTTTTSSTPPSLLSFSTHPPFSLFIMSAWLRAVDGRPWTYVRLCYPNINSHGN